jgi:hypothetical protein
MRQQLRAFRSLAWLTGPKKHRELSQQRQELEAQLARMSKIIDDFAQLLGPRNWIFQSRLPLDEVEAFLTLDPETAEKAFIQLHRSGKWLPFWVMQLSGIADLRPRQGLLRRALADYEADRFYSCTLLLISVMDGFVNDVDKQARRGLHTRTGQELQAWDSVVGHHLGLTHVMPEFLLPVKALRVEPVFEVHRHGIVHGMEVDHDNVIVATKAWNYLFAVVDWAEDLEKQKVPDPPPTTWRDIYNTIRDHAQWKTDFEAAMRDWTDKMLSPQDPEWEDDAVYRAANGFLGAWKEGNYGVMAQTLSPRSSRRTGAKPAAGATREDFHGFGLDDFKITSIHYLSYAMAIVEADVTINGTPRHVDSRWSYESPTKSLPIPGTDPLAQWSRVFSGPDGWQ